MAPVLSGTTAPAIKGLHIMNKITQESVRLWHERNVGKSVSFLGMFSRFIGNYGYCPDRFAASKDRVSWLQVYPELRTGWNRIRKAEYEYQYQHRYDDTQGPRVLGRRSPREMLADHRLFRDQPSHQPAATRGLHPTDPG